MHAQKTWTFEGYNMDIFEISKTQESSKTANTGAFFLYVFAIFGSERQFLKSLAGEPPRAGDRHRFSRLERTPLGPVGGT